MTTPRLLHTTGGPPLTARLLLTGYASAQPPPLTLTLLCEGLADPNGLVIGSGGVLYGTTNAGGGIGQAYSLTPPVSPGAPWTYTVLHNFAGPDGALPTGVLAIGRGGVLYGVTHLGGGGNCYPEGCGVVYALIPPASSGGTWSFRVPYRFMTDASSRPAGVVVGAGGVLYGSTTYGHGTLFSLTPPASPGAAWTYAQLYSFTDPGDASFFTHRASLFQSRDLARYHALIARIRAQYGGTPVGASESIFALQAPALGLRLVTPPGFMKAVSEGTEATAADTSAAQRQLTDHAVKVWILNSQNVTPDVEQLNGLARSHGIPIATVTETLTPAGATFEQWQVAQLQGIARALHQATGR